MRAHLFFDDRADWIEVKDRLPRLGWTIGVFSRPAPPTNGWRPRLEVPFKSSPKKRLCGPCQSQTTQSRVRLKKRVYESDRSKIIPPPATSKAGFGPSPPGGDESAFRRKPVEPAPGGRRSLDPSSHSARPGCPELAAALNPSVWRDGLRAASSGARGPRSLRGRGKIEPDSRVSRPSRRTERGVQARIDPRVPWPRLPLARDPRVRAVVSLRLLADPLIQTPPCRASGAGWPRDTPNSIHSSPS